jgi:hypothetical protein
VSRRRAVRLSDLSSEVQAQIRAAGGALPTDRKPSKHMNEPQTWNGETFHSKAELHRFVDLSKELAAGEIADLERQPRYRLLDGFRDNDGIWREPIDYVADFRYVRLHPEPHLVVEDVKPTDNKVTADFALKQKLFQHRYGGIRFRRVDKYGRWLEAKRVPKAAPRRKA